MARLRMRLRVHFDDGRDPVDVVAGQREMSDWERSPLGGSSARVEEQRPITWLMYLAYAALRRTLQVGRKVDFDGWLGDVAEVEALDDEDDDAGPGVDPTRPDRPHTA